MKVNGLTISDNFNIVLAIPQQSLLGPLVNVVNDLITLFLNKFAYADDTIIYSIAPTKNFFLLSATSRFKKVTMLCTSSCFTVNVFKTHVCVFSNRRLSDPFVVLLVCIDNDLSNF